MNTEDVLMRNLMVVEWIPKGKKKSKETGCLNSRSTVKMQGPKRITSEEGNERRIADTFNKIFIEKLLGKRGPLRLLLVFN